MVMSSTNVNTTSVNSALPQPTAMSQLNTAAVVATTAVTAAALAAQTKTDDSSKLENILHAGGLIFSETGILVKLGSTGGTPQKPKERIEAEIAEKIEKLRKDANDPKNLQSVRSELCELTKISHVHYRELKNKVFDLFIQVMNSDPIEPFTKEGILEIVCKLNADLAVENATMMSIDIQKKLARAFSAAVELYLRHYQKKHLNAIAEAQKKAFLATQDSLNAINKQQDLGVEFANQMALEASKRLTDDSTRLSQFLDKFQHFVTALSKAFDKNVVDFFSEFKQVFDGLQYKFTEKWYDTLFLLHDLVQHAPNNQKKVMAIQALLKEQKESCEWQLIYGSLELLEEMVSQCKEVRVLENALFGQSVRGSSPTTTAAATSPISIRIPGVVDFIDFNQKKSANTDVAIRTKAERLCAQIITKLSATLEGRQAMSYHYVFASRKRSSKGGVLKVLGTIVPTDPKMHEAWVRSGSELHNLPPTRRISWPKPLSPTSQKIANLQQNEKEWHEKSPKATTATAAASPAPTTLQSEKNNKSIHAAADSLDTLTPEFLFLLAVSHGQLAYVKKQIVQNKSLLEVRDSKGNTPLMLAASEGNIKMFEALLAAGADPLAKNFGRNVMHVVADRGETEMVRLLASNKLLINSRENPNEQSPMNVTPLMMAAHSLEAFEVLLKAGADPLAVDCFDETVMHYAARFGNVEVIQLLAPHKKLLDAKESRGWTPLMFAAEFNHRQACEALLKLGANPLAEDEQKWNALHHATHRTNRSVVQLLAQNKMLVNSRDDGDCTPLLRALYNLEITYELSEEHQRVFEELIKAGADPLVADSRGDNAMHLTVCPAGIDILKQLLAYPQLLNAKNKNGETPLMRAAGGRGISQLRTEGRELSSDYYDRVGMALRILLKAGADPLAKDNEGRTAMHYAAENGNLFSVRMLLEHKQLLTAKDNEGKTPLMLAAQEELEEEGVALEYNLICETLLKAGADPLAKDNEGHDAAHYANLSGNAKLVKLLSAHKLFADSNK